MAEAEHVSKYIAHRCAQWVGSGVLWRERIRRMWRATATATHLFSFSHKSPSPQQHQQHQNNTPAKTTINSA